ncbi:MAG TPA: GAF domain-containing protein [Aggregatilineales bacterium]|nr:GAF domain-containing protein [Aggregatilineales bacterium]
MQTRNLSLISLAFTPRHRYADSLDDMRARVTLAYAVFLLLGAAFAVVGGLVILGTRPQGQGVALSALASAIIPLIVVGLVHVGRLRVAEGLLYAVLTVIALIGVRNGVADNNVLLLSLSMLYAGLVWQWRGTLLTMVIQIVLIAVAATLQLRAPGGLDSATISLNVFVDLALIIGIGLIVGGAASELKRALLYSSRIAAQLRATSEVAQRASAYIDLNELLQQVVTFIRDRFAFYHVQIFMNDPEQRFTNLVASTGEMGAALLQRGYRLAVGSQGIIGQAALLGEPIQTSTEQDDEEPINRRNERLAETRSELALPLIARDHVIGVLHIQSTRPHAFNQDDVDSLSILAAHTSIAINNAQLFQEQRSALNENRRLFIEAEANLREIQLLNRRLTGEAWESYLEARPDEVVGYTLSNNQLRTDAVWTGELEQAVHNRQVVITQNGTQQVIAVPIELRGRAIGAIEVEVSAGARQSDTLEMLQSVAQRLALSVDNARLFEQTQERAQQELQVNAISARLQAVNSMDDLIRITVSELGQALGASEASIRLGLNLLGGKQAGTSAPNGHNGNNGTGSHG